MHVQRFGDLFYVARGRTTESYFCFYVDDAGSCWSKYYGFASGYKSSQEAHNAIGELKRRAHVSLVRRQARP